MSILLTILRMLPAILQAIIAINDAIPEGGKGPTKKQLILGVLQIVLDANVGLDGRTVPLVEKVIDSSVSTLKSGGVID